LKDTHVTNRTAWTGGNLNSGLGWTSFFGTELNSLANGSSVLSSVAAITNGTGLDMFYDVAFKLTIASSTIAAGANLTLWLFKLNQDGTTYGDNSLTTSGAAVTPGLFPTLVMPLRAAATQTTLFGVNGDPLVMPPGTWLPALQNNSGFALAASTNAAYFRSYNLQLNN
jgi:hypothetical protein